MYVYCDELPGLQLIKSDCTVLSNNTAITDSGEISIGCVTHLNISVAWKNRLEGNISITANSNAAVKVQKINNGLKLVTTVPMPPNSHLVQGIYECTAPQEGISLYVGLYPPSGKG